MSKIPALSCTMAAAFALISGMAMGTNDAEAQLPRPEVADTAQPTPNPQPKEEAETQSDKSSTPSNEEPSCD